MTDAKDRLSKLFQLYKVYVEKHQKGPPDEKALREFGKKLSEKDLSDYMIGKDLESIFTSPRDKQPFAIRYSDSLDSGGEPRAIAWEVTGEGGKRYVALSMGYVEEYDEETFKQYQKK
jgi:hypothetical protein